MSLACLCDGPTDADGIYCCEALVFWAEARYDAAWKAAERALAADPGHSPSWLLYAYARYKGGHRAEAMALLEGLASDPDVGSRARRALRINHHRHDRDQVHLSVGLDGGLGTSMLFMADVPLSKPWGVRAEWRFFTGGDNVFEQTGGGSLGLTWNATAGVWRYQISANLQGIAGQQPDRMHSGVYAANRIDVRVMQAAGLGVELGVGTIGDDGDLYPHVVGRVFATAYLPGRRYW